MIVRCLLHVHSAFSYDSRSDLADIAATARRHGFRCVLMSEHNNKMDAVQMAAFVRRCDELSDPHLLVVPGLELAFDSNRVHLLAYGVRQFIDSSAPDCTFAGLVRAVRGSGGLPVLAHPSHRQAIERLSESDFAGLAGIEIWNVKNGNRFCPSGPDIRTLRQLRARGERVFGFGGVDWHHLNNFEPLAVSVEVAELSQASIFAALDAGRFRVRGRFASIDASGAAGSPRLAMYTLGSRALIQSRQTAYRWQRALERRGVRTPRVLAALARRVF